MKRNMMPLLGIAFVAAVVATGVVYGLFGGRLRSKTVEVTGQSIVVAARDLDRGTVIKAGDLQLSEVKGALKGSYSKVDDAVGGTLLNAVQKNEPLLEDRVASLEPKAGAPTGVAAGMRAVSIRVAESSGLMGLLHAGSRVDLQAVMEHNSTAELRTILQNVEVLRISPQSEPVGNNRAPVPIATLLVPAQYADLIALADTAARIRMTLRNPLDDAAPPRRSLGLAAVFNGPSAVESHGDSSVAPKNNAASRAAANPSANPAQSSGNANKAEQPIQLRVQVLGVSPAALGQLHSKLAPPSDAVSSENAPMRVASFRADTNASEMVRQLERSHEVEVVSSSLLTAAVGRPVSVRASASPYRLRVQFSPAADSLGKVSLRVQPEISLRRGPGVESRRYDADLPDDGSFLVSGLLKDLNDANILSRLYPGHAWGGRELVIFVTTRSGGQLPPAVAQTARRP